MESRIKPSKLIYIGIDQTGAVNAKGLPKPLPACIIDRRNISFFYLPQLNRLEIEKNFGVLNPLETVICLDCVLGLPLDCGFNFNDCIRLIQTTQGYGRKIASDFFKKIGQGRIYRRQVEIQLNANSVFQEHPFQKNIQTGTYRFWKEIALFRADFYAPALEKPLSKDQIPLVEGYPSYSWKKILNSNVRRPEKIRELILKNKIPVVWTDDHAALVKKDPNFADAFLLALTAQKYYGFKKFKSKIPEGHILGADE